MDCPVDAFGQISLQTGEQIGGTAAYCGCPSAGYISSFYGVSDIF